MASAAKPYFRKRSSGVTRIIRDGYGKKSDWFARCKIIKARDGHKCVFCGKPENPKAGIFHDVHHLIGVAQGGTTTNANLATTCEQCHAKRPKHGHMKVAAPKPTGKSIHVDLTSAPKATTSKFSNWKK